MIKNVYEFLQNSAQKFPQKIALVDAFYDGVNHKSYTYKELDLMVKALANNIAQKYTQEKIAIILPQGANALISIYAMALSANCYCFMDPKWPIERLAESLEYIDAKMIICENELKNQLLKNENCKNYEFLEPNIAIQNELNCIDEELLQRCLDLQIDTDLLCLVFTSGTSGNAKAVCMSHKNMITHIDNFCHKLQLSENDNVACSNSYAFSGTHKEIYPAIYRGATLHNVKGHIYASPKKLLEYFDSKNINIAQIGTPLMKLLARALKKEKHKLEKIFYSGEIVASDVLNDLISACDDIKIYNFYGSTEAISVCGQIIKKLDNLSIVPIGKALKNAKIYLFDENKNLITPDEVGKKGFLHAGGSQVSMGYYKNPEKTAEVFIQNPLHNNYRDIVYNFGDIGAYNEFGELVCYGRADNQVKFNGHKIELSEIENIAYLCDEVEATLCVFDNEKLFLFYSGKPDINDVKTELAKHLFNQIMPTKIIKLDEIKRNSNGKIDRNYYKTNYKELIK